MLNSVLQYILGYCTWWGLATIGEPPLTKSLPSDCHILGGFPPVGTSHARNESKEPMPVWLIPILFALFAAKYIFSFLIAYVFQVISTVLMVSSADDTSIRAAVYALKHPLVPARGDGSSPRTPKPIPKKTALYPKPLKRSLTRQMTIPIESLGKKFFNLPYLRGLNAFLMISITQWYFSTIGDLFLSGQPKELKSGYGSTSIILAVFFGGSFALWTHNAITRPRNSRNIYENFPRGQDIIVELYPITALWALCEQMVRSLPLALSRNRIFAPLRQYAWAPKLWNNLDGKEQRILLFKFAVLFLFYLVLVAGLSIPASMTLRRIHASMLPEADEAIVPFVHGNPKPRKDEESWTHSPGLSISEAWGTLNWNIYMRVVKVFVIYWIVKQAFHFLCWEANWLLHDLFGVDRYASPFPPGPTSLTLRFVA